MQVGGCINQPYNKALIFPKSPLLSFYPREKKTSEEPQEAVSIHLRVWLQPSMYADKKLLLFIFIYGSEDIFLAELLWLQAKPPSRSTGNVLKIEIDNLFWCSQNMTQKFWPFSQSLEGFTQRGKHPFFVQKLNFKKSYMNFPAKNTQFSSA